MPNPKNNNTACFSGYRPQKFPFSLERDNPPREAMLNRIEETIRSAVNSGYTSFICGMAAGFDLLCANVLLNLRTNYEEYGHLELIAAVPFKGHKPSNIWKNIYNDVLKQAIHVEVICPGYTNDCFITRNMYMVNNSGLLICYWDGQSGGTSFTVNYARRKGLDVINLSGE